MTNGTNPHEPAHGSRCTDVLSDTLRGYAGIERAEFNIEEGKLNIAYDPRILSREQAMRLIHQSGQHAAMRVLQCRAKGPGGCAACAREMGQQLIEHYTRLANTAAPTTQFHAAGAIGAIEVQINNPTILGEDTAEIASAPTRKEAEKDKVLSRERLEILFTVVNAVTGLAAFFTGMAGAAPLLTGVLWAISYAAGGWYGLLDGFETLKEKKLDVNLLMILAALGAALIGQPVEGAVLLFLFSLSNTLQTFAMGRSRKAIEKLLDLRPPVASVRRGSRVITLPVEKIIPGDTVLVRPGERFPIDGDVTEGASDVNQASITGESMPVHKQPGDPVFAGTVNGNGALEVRATRLAKDTTLAKIVQMVEVAQTSKAQTQRMLDDFEQVYALIVLGGAALLILVPYFLLQQAFFPTFYRAMTWLVVASPCALVISTPASILSAIANGARNGVLFKGGVHLEKASTLKVIAFDKTGTLTSGKPKLVTLEPFDGRTEEDLLRITGAVEARSEHPLAAALVQEAKNRGLKLQSAEDFRAIPGQGVEGRVGDQVVWIGSRRLFFERGVTIPPQIMARMEAVESAGQTAMLAYSAGNFLGLLGSADVIRADAREMIQKLKANGITQVVMLTGDNERVAAQIAREAGVDAFHANLLPQDKVTLLRALREQYGPVAMVGDGVNDAPALASADVGIAMGGAGTDVALETADVVLMSDDLQKLPHAVGLARHARRIVWQNLVFALAVIVLLVVGAFGAQLPLPLGVVGHEGSTVLVVLNGLRLIGYKL